MSLIYTCAIIQNTCIWFGVGVGGGGGSGGGVHTSRTQGLDLYRIRFCIRNVQSCVSDIHKSIGNIVRIPALPIREN